MFQYWRDTFKKHRRGILISGGIAAATYVAGKYIAGKVSEFQDKLKQETFAKEQVKRRFKQTQNDCYMTFLSLLPVLVEPIYEDINVEEITRELQSRRSTRSKHKTAGSPSDQARSVSGLSTVVSEEFGVKQLSQDDNEDSEKLGTGFAGSRMSKAELWDTLKIKSLTRFLTVLYSEAILIVFLHLQLNILSRRSYYETAVKLASQRTGVYTGEEKTTPESTLPEQAFLSFSWWFINKGWQQFKAIIEESVEDVFGEIKPRQELTIDEFAALINTVQQKVHTKILIGTEDDNGNSTNVIVTSLLPTPDMEFYLLQQTNGISFLTDFNSDPANSDTLSKLLDELKDYLTNEQVASMLNLLVTVGISKVLDNIFSGMIDKGADDQGLLTEQRQKKVKLASLLASITKQSSQLTSNSFDNEILFVLNNLQELDDLSATVYSNFDD